MGGSGYLRAHQIEEGHTIGENEREVLENRNAADSRITQGNKIKADQHHDWWKCTGASGVTFDGDELILLDFISSFSSTLSSPNTHIHKSLLRSPGSYEYIRVVR